VFRFTPRPLYLRVKNGRCSLNERGVNSNVDEDALDKKNLVSLPGIELRFLSLPSRTLAITATEISQIRKYLGTVC
jgi:hypothetical protein